MNLHVFVLLLVTTSVLMFHQSDYKLIIERLSIDYYNADYIQHPKLDLFHYTRYEKRINWSGFLLTDLGNDITEAIQAYKFQSNEYREFPMIYKANGCDDYMHDKFGTNTAHYNSNFVGCPVNKGFYYAVNVHIDESKFPPFAPRGRYMLEIALYHKKTILFLRGKGYIKIEPTNPLERVIMK